jgi:ABC-type sulfate/molybdate transport systems ATPase subunit
LNAPFRLVREFLISFIACAFFFLLSGDLYLLDDPLSAVDTHVAKKLVDDCIAGPGALLKGTTRILVTHQVQFLQLADKVVVMEGGAVAAAGSFAELQAAGKLNDLLDGAGRTQSGAGRAESVARERRVSSLGQPLEDEQSAEDKAEQTKVPPLLVPPRSTLLYGGASRPARCHLRRGCLGPRRGR